ncbi:MAG: hypoxanthine-guanine phosphoribosyltransferase [Pseudomonadota bacterium]
MSITPQKAQHVFEESDCIHDAAAVESALDRMAATISAELKDADPVVLCVMTGGVVAAGRLLTRLDFPLTLDYVHATRYRGGTRGDDLEWRTRLNGELKERNVLILDDILDEGYTLQAIVTACQDLGAARVVSAVLVAKRHDRGSGFQADIVGLEVPDRYVFGYGMDYHGYWRNAPGIYALPETHS